MAEANMQVPRGSKGMLWAGWALSGLATLALLFSGVMKLMGPAELVTEFTRLGYPSGVILGIGLAELACAILYAVPRTAVLGAILLTGYLGGATATHVRLEESFLSPVIIGVLVWVGLYLREERLRRLVPLRVST
jgi:hypothetical protein